MAPGAQIDYDALASQSGGAPAVNYDALAGQYGGAPSQPVAPPPTDDQIPSPHESALEGITGFMNDVYTGVTHGIAKTAQGISHLTGAPEIPQAAASAAEPNANPEQARGELMENILEFMMGDEAIKGLSLADKLKAVQPVIKVAEKFPNVAKALNGAARVGTVSAGQTAIKGGSPSDIAEQGLIGAATGGLVEGGAGKLTDAIAERSPQVSNVAGENIVTPKPAQVPPEVQQAQTAGKNVIAKSAQGATEQNLTPLADETRPMNNQGSAGTNPRVITRPPVVDVPAAVARVQSFGDAADEVESGAKAAYKNLNDATGGKFEALRDQVKQAGKDVWNAIGPADRDAAQLRLDNANNQMQQLFEEAGGRVTKEDWQSANKALTAAKTLRQVHNAVESTFDTDAGFSQRSGTYRGFNGNQLRANLNRLTQKIGEPELNRVIGRDNMDNLRKVAELTRTNADRAKFGATVQKVAGWLARDSAAAGAGALLGHITGVGGFGGAVTGEAAYMAARKVMQMVATNPRIGQQLTFAVESGARPEYYAPLIGKMIRDAEEEGKVPNIDDSQTMAVHNPAGMVEQGNLPIWNRPMVQNADGSHSSEYSTSFEDENGREVLVPTVVNGKFLTPDGQKPPEGSPAEKEMFKRAWSHYEQTGENLGKFDNPDDADAYASILHNRGDRKSQ